MATKGLGQWCVCHFQERWGSHLQELGFLFDVYRDAGENPSTASLKKITHTHFNKTTMTTIGWLAIFLAKINTYLSGGIWPTAQSYRALYILSFIYDSLFGLLTSPWNSRGLFPSPWPGSLLEFVHLAWGSWLPRIMGKLVCLVWGLHSQKDEVGTSGFAVHLSSFIKAL